MAGEVTLGHSRPMYGAKMRARRYMLSHFESRQNTTDILVSWCCISIPLYLKNNIIHILKHINLPEYENRNVDLEKKHSLILKEVIKNRIYYVGNMSNNNKLRKKLVRFSPV